MPGKRAERKKAPSDVSKKPRTKKASSKKSKSGQKRNPEKDGKNAAKGDRCDKKLTDAAKAGKQRQKTTAAAKADNDRKTVGPTTAESTVKDNEEYENLADLMNANSPPHLIPADTVSLRIPVKPAEQVGDPKDEKPILQPNRGGATVSSDYVAHEMHPVQSSSKRRSFVLVQGMNDVEHDAGTYMASSYRPHSTGSRKTSRKSTKASRSSKRKSSK